MTTDRMGPRPGDVLRRRKGPVMHVGVMLDEGRVLHNVPGRGEHITDLTDFAAGRRLHVERLDESRRLRLLAAANRGAGGRDYHLLRNNCEHTVHRLRDGQPRSPQLKATALAVLIAGAGLLLTRHWGGALAGWALAGRLTRER